MICLALSLGIGLGLGLTSTQSTTTTTKQSTTASSTVNLLPGSTKISVNGSNLGYFSATGSTGRAMCSNINTKNFTSFETGIVSALKNLSDVGPSISDIFIIYTCR